MKLQIVLLSLFSASALAMDNPRSVLVLVGDAQAKVKEYVLSRHQQNDLIIDQFRNLGNHPACVESVTVTTINMKMLRDDINRVLHAKCPEIELKPHEEETRHEVSVTRTVQEGGFTMYTSLNGHPTQEELAELLKP